MKYLFLSLLYCLPYTLISAQDTFKSVKINKQVWMAKNLTVSKFRNGDIIPEAESDSDWVKAGREHKPAWCYYNQNKDTGRKYGKLYNYFAMMDTRGLAPSGWHIPNPKDWDTLHFSLGDWSAVGNKLKTTSGWKKGGNGNNSTGFCALPAGKCSVKGKFTWLGTGTFFLTLPIYPSDFTQIEQLISFNSELSPGFSDFECGFSCRCIKDK